MTLTAQSSPRHRLSRPRWRPASASTEGINEWLSDKLNHPVTLGRCYQPAGPLPSWRARHRRLRAGTARGFWTSPEEPLPDLAGFEELLEFESPPGTYFDAFYIHYESAVTGHHESAEGESRFDVKRFDPTCYGYPRHRSSLSRALG